VIAFSTARPEEMPGSNRGLPQGERLQDDDLSVFFQATLEATEEAIYNSLFKATTVTGIDGHTAEALPLEEVKAILKKYGRLK